MQQTDQTKQEIADWKGEGACMVDRPGGYAEPVEASELNFLVVAARSEVWLPRCKNSNLIY